MKFTHDEYRAQGLFPPCPRAVYIPSSSPHCAGDCWAPDDSTELFVAWEQRCMSTGGVYTTRLWWVPQSELTKTKHQGVG
jgi:hypothetical protein